MRAMSPLNWTSETLPVPNFKPHFSAMCISVHGFCVTLLNSFSWRGTAVSEIFRSASQPFHKEGHFKIPYRSTDLWWRGADAVQLVYVSTACVCGFPGAQNPGSQFFGQVKASPEQLVCTRACVHVHKSLLTWQVWLRACECVHNSLRTCPRELVYVTGCVVYKSLFTCPQQLAYVSTRACLRVHNGLFTWQVVWSTRVLCSTSCFKEGTCSFRRKLCPQQLVCIAQLP